MSKKKHHNAEHVNHERWLVSYADFITLLFAFFVVLFSSSQSDRSKTNKMSLSIQAAFSEFSLFKDRGGELNLMASESTKSASTVTSGKSLISQDGQPIFMAPSVVDEAGEKVKIVKGQAGLSEGVGLPTTEDRALARAHMDMVRLLEMEKMDDAMDVSDDPRGVVISVREAALFGSGSDQLTAKSKELLSGIGAVLSRVPNQVRVEGHSDAQSVKAPFTNSWALSAARATSVVQWYVQDYKINPARFVVIGYGSYRATPGVPLAGQVTVTQARNDRVDIVLLSEEAARLEAMVPNSLDEDQDRKILPTHQLDRPKTPSFMEKSPTE